MRMTPLPENYDPSLLRRIQRHIKFRNPDASMRWELFALHLPSPDRVQADDAVLSELSKGLSGGDILNICVNAIHAGKHGCESGAVDGDAGDVGARDCEGEEG
jgi:SpoVK/Ycf46/Vps4 family AAA+-type ATPase